MHVLLIAEEYPPVDGGIGVSVQRIAANLRRLGIAVTVATYDHVPTGDPRAEHTSYVLEERDERGTEVFRVGPLPVAVTDARGRNVGTMYRTFGTNCLRVAQRTQPDIIHSFGVWQVGYTAAVVAQQLRLPHVVGVRGNDIGRDLYNPSRFGAIQFVFRAAAHVAFVAHGLFQLASDVFGPHRNWSIIHNGCELEEASQPSALANNVLRSMPSGRAVVGLFGHVREKKGVLEVLRATLHMPLTSRPNVLIVGEHPAEEWYAHALANVVATAAESGTTIHQTGRVDRKTVQDLMRSCDVVVQASLDDGLPNTLLEGMATGCPIVASAIFRADVGDDTVEFCDPYVDASIVTALTRVLGDKAYRNVLSANARRAAAERFSADREAAAYIRLYDDVLRETRQSLPV